MSAHQHDVRSFWDERARRFGSDRRATLGDTGLRELEIRTMLKLMRRRRPSAVLDVGCGNGYSSRRFAEALPNTRFVGVDYSPEMIRAAREGAPENTTFEVADVLDESSLPEGRFDMVITQRCVQNLPDWTAQQAAIRNLISRRAESGAVVLMECSRDGVDALNQVRRDAGLRPIEGIEPWHNRFLRDGEVVEAFGARVVHFSSTYMFLAKVVHPWCARFAWRLPALGRFGYDRMYVIG